jgi:hypothetical protein
MAVSRGASMIIMWCTFEPLCMQLFVLLLQNFEKVVQMIQLKMFGGAPNGCPFAPLEVSILEVFYLFLYLVFGL